MKKLLLLSFCAFFVWSAEAFSLENNSLNGTTFDCGEPSANFEVQSDCEHGEQFLIEVEITGIDGANEVKVYDDQGSVPQYLEIAGTYTFGPYPNGAVVLITVENADNDSCFIISDELTQEYCSGDPISVEPDTYTIEELITDVLIGTPCAQVSNITSTTAYDFGSTGKSVGYFTADPVNFGVTSGIIMSSGYIEDAEGPYDTGSQSGGLDWPGDDDIDDIIAEIEGPGALTSNNASVIEFDFTPFTDHISFNFLFASEEYGTFQCSYSDAFGFFLTDEDGNTTNLAVVPDTDIPVAVTTIRDNQYISSPSPGCNSENVEYFDKYYGVPNGLPLEADPLNMHGYTVKMTAESDVQPGHTYHIKLAIADRGDTAYDSAVFLEAGSFDLGSIDLGADLTPENGNAPCSSEPVILDSGIEPSDFVEISWYKDNELIEGETEPTLEVTESGTYTVLALYGDSCVVSDEIEVIFVDAPEIDFDLGDDVSICGDEPLELDATPINLDDLPDLIYVWYRNGEVIEGETGPIIEVTDTGLYSVEVTTIGSNCTAEAEVDVDFSTPPILDLGADFSVTDLDGVTLDATPSNMDIDGLTFEWTYNGDPIPEDGPIVYPEDYGFGTYTVVVYGNNPDCSATDEITITQDNIDCNVELSVDGDLSKTLHFCQGEGIPTYEITFTAEFDIENASDEDLGYTWYLNGDEITEAEGNTYTLVYDSEGEYNDEIMVEAMASNCTASATLETEVNITPSEHPCKITEGLSPGNNDGINDYLDLTFLSDRSGIEKLEVFNRYGNKVYDENNYVDSWHGQDNNGNDLTTGTYYYIITMKNEDPEFGRVKKGWIYINRKVN